MGLIIYYVTILLTYGTVTFAELLSSTFKAVFHEHPLGNEHGNGDEHCYGNGMGIVMDWGWEWKIPMGVWLAGMG